MRERDDWPYRRTEEHGYEDGRYHRRDYDFDRYGGSDQDRAYWHGQERAEDERREERRREERAEEAAAERRADERRQEEAYLRAQEEEYWASYYEQQQEEPIPDLPDDKEPAR